MKPKLKQETLELLDLAQEFNVTKEEWRAYCIMLKEGFLGAYVYTDGKVEYFTYNMEGGETHLDVEKFDKLRKFVSLFKGERYDK